jgi:hypothetical protein
VLPIKLVGAGEDARVFVTKLEIALRASRRVLRALAVVAVRKGKH